MTNTEIINRFISDAKQHLTNADIEQVIHQLNRLWMENEKERVNIEVNERLKINNG